MYVQYALGRHYTPTNSMRDTELGVLGIDYTASIGKSRHK